MILQVPFKYWNTTKISIINIDIKTQSVTESRKETKNVDNEGTSLTKKDVNNNKITIYIYIYKKDNYKQ